MSPTVSTPEDPRLRSAIQAKKPGDKMTLDVNRGGTARSVSVTVGTRSVQNS